MTLGGRDSAPIYPPLRMDKLGQAGHWVAWHRVPPVRGTPVTQTRLPFSPGEYHRVSSDCQPELRETFYSATYPAPFEAPRNLTSISPASFSSPNPPPPCPSPFHFPRPSLPLPPCSLPPLLFLPLPFLSLTSFLVPRIKPGPW